MFFAEKLDFINQLRKTDGCPLAGDLAERCFPSLTSDDVANDDSWLETPILVPSNAQRCNFLSAIMPMLALKLNVPLFTWWQPMAGDLSAMSVEDLNLIRSHSPGLKAYFACGAPALIAENINHFHRLANGTHGSYHSLVLDDDAPQSDFDLVERAVAGSINHLSQPPLFENIAVVVDESLARSWPRENCISITEIEPEVLVPGAPVKFRVVIPIRMAWKTKMSDVNGLPGRKSVAFRPSGVMPMAVLTYHKVQSLTLPKVIMHLRRPPAGLAHLLTLPAVYVGSTRTRLASGDRRLGPAGGLHDLHLQKMTHDPILGVWMSAYTSTVGGSFEASAIDRASVVRLGKIAPKKPAAANKKKAAAVLAAATARDS